MKAKVRIDLNNRMWVDVYEATIQDMHRASLLGGVLIVYPIFSDEYRLGFNFNCGTIHVQFVGVNITKEHYETQKRMWGDSVKYVSPGTELCLIDNQYFV